MDTAQAEERLPRPRADSFQRMLDMEKRYKLARFHKTQKSPALDSTDSLPTRSPTLFLQENPSLATPQISRIPSLAIKVPQSTKAAETRLQERRTNDTDNAEEEEGMQSDHSSICHSPSWEEYDQKKKNRRRTANRLSKPPPQDRGHAVDKHPSGSSASTQEKAPSLGATRRRSALEDHKGKHCGADPIRSTDSLHSTTAGKASYPPPSSRSWNLNGSLFSTRNSSSLISAPRPEEVLRNTRGRDTTSQNNSYSNESLPDQSAVGPPYGHRQSSESDRSASYVRHARTQSIERSISGFLEQTALMPPINLLSQPSSPLEQQFSPMPIEHPVIETTQTPEAHREEKSQSHQLIPLAALKHSGETDSEAPTGGILSSIRSRIRRSSSASGNVSLVAARNFREKARAAMHLPPPANIALPQMALPGPRKESKTLQMADQQAKKPAAQVIDSIRPLEVSSVSSYHGGSSTSPSPPTTPDTSRPQSTKGLPAPIEEIQAGSAKQRSFAEYVTARYPETLKVESLDGRMAPETGEAHRKGTVGRPPGRSRLLRNRKLPGNQEGVLRTIQTYSGGDEAAVEYSGSFAGGFADGLGVLEKSWKHNPTTPDADTLSFVTTLTSQEASDAANNPKDPSNQAGIDLRKSHESRGHESKPHIQRTDRRGVMAKRDAGGCSRDKASPVGTRVISVPSKDAVLSTTPESAQMVVSPLSKMIRSAKASMTTPSVELDTATSVPIQQTSNALLPFSAGRSAMPPRQNSVPLPRPLAKMFVECCHCKFFHDMPARVYECMAQPNAVVTDQRLGVSGAITTMVKCPWCSHNMSKQCCAGYTAVVYLKERLH